MSAADEAIAQSIAIGESLVNTRAAEILGQSSESRLRDVLTDLAHWAYHNDIDFMAAADGADLQATAEKSMR